jgi:glycerol-1-phosphate dehydrogenase [NAD(P)+]
MSRLDQPLDQALASARDTRFLAIECGIRHRAGEVFASLFGPRPAVIVADERTFEAAGHGVQESFRRASRDCLTPFLFPPGILAEESRVVELEAALAPEQAVPVAVGSGTINDLTKLAAHRLGRPYLAVATAASMDGYTAFGASILHEGSKQTFACPAPAGVLADLDVIARAPRELNAAGYADLLAKNVAGADWILADVAGVEPIDRPVWETVHASFRSWIDRPGRVAQGELETLRRLLIGLMATGLAMQAARSSRPASGAEHQFSHLWDMQQHTHHGVPPSHGFKVGIGTLASLALHAKLLSCEVGQMDITRAVERWPSLERIELRIERVLGTGALAAKAREETRAKYPTREELCAQLERIRAGWPGLRERLSRHLIPLRETRESLLAAGCPVEPEEIGISRGRLRDSFEQASYLRRRFTILDVVQRLDLMNSALGELFSPTGPWPEWVARP